MDEEGLRRAVWRPPWASLARAVVETAEERGVAVYVVGGYLRDLLLERRPRDLDLVVVGDGVGFAARLAERLGAEIAITPRFLTARLEVQAGDLDVSTARRESYPSQGALPVVEPGTIEDDIARRDFTVNSFALGVGGPTTEGLRAASGARRDLAAGRLAVLHPGSFEDDPTRILRGVVLEARLGFRLAPETEASARQVAESGGFDPVSGARLWQELADPLASDRAGSILARLEDLGVLSTVGAGIRFDGSVGRRLERAMEIYARLGAGGERGAVERSALALVALCWDSDRTAVRRWVDRLALPGVVAAALDGAGAAAARELGEDAAADLRPSVVHALLADLSVPELAVLAAEVGERGAEMVRRELEEWRPLRLTVRAADLLAHGAAEGPEIGRALEATRRARLDARIEASEELRYALGMLEETQGTGSGGEAS